MTKNTLAFIAANAFLNGRLVDLVDLGVESDFIQYDMALPLPPEATDDARFMDSVYDLVEDFGLKATRPSSSNPFKTVPPTEKGKYARGCAMNRTIFEDMARRCNLTIETLPQCVNPGIYLQLTLHREDALGLIEHVGNLHAAPAL